MSIEEMEKYKSLYCRDYPKADIWVASFMEHCINSLKDLHDGQAKIWKALAEMGYKEEIKEKFVTDKNDWEYPYEPNE
jgi:hypothetical protein